MKILVTGGSGLVGSAIKEVSHEYADLDILFFNRQDCNLLDQESVKHMMDITRPDAVIHTAARVGGIGLNLSTPGQQFYENIMMNTMIIHYAYKHGVNNLISFSSICAFPEGAKELSEDILQNAQPHPAHRSYAYSKRMVDIQIEAYNKEYDLNYCSVIPGNIFGKRDNFNLEHGHVIPSLIHKCYMAKKNNDVFDVWGDGTPMREFVYSNDIARACLDLLLLEKMPQRLIVSGEKEHTIKNIVTKICNKFDYHNVNWLKDKPNGQLRRPSSNTVFKKTLPGFKFTNIDDALSETVSWFNDTYPKIRR
jgi:GDP-L-fucose synthase